MEWRCSESNDPAIATMLAPTQNVTSLRIGPLCLPGLHTKAGLEVPSPFVAATKNTIVPKFSAPSMNCGMGMILSSLSKNEMDENFFTDFSRLIRREVSPRFSRLKTISLWLGLMKRPRLAYDLTKKELEEVIRDGAAAVLKKYNLPWAVLDHIEHRGSLFNNQEREAIDITEILPRSSYTNGLHDMGFNFGGNHFLEIHYVEDIKDAATADAWGLKQNQIVFFYHGGGGHATYHLGRYFANRAKNTAFEKGMLFFLKLFFHFSSLNGVARALQRWRYYFSLKPFPEIPLHTKEGVRLMQSIKGGLNYGYAFRLAILARVRDALAAMMPNPPALSLLYDAAHNSIVEETHQGELLIIHRQDAMVARAGMPVFIAGFNNTRSYLGVATGNTGTSLGSVSASAAAAMRKRSSVNPPSPLKPPRTTTIYRHKEPFRLRAAHVSDEGLLEIAHVFENDGSIKPVAFIRPLAVIKGPR